jgi:GNAT superfamily N-acetyltransferase
MRILSFDELTPEMERSRGLVNLAAFGNLFTSARIDFLRSRLRCFSEYVGVFGVEGDQVLGQVFVLRIPYDFPDGRGEISGIAAVGTLPEAGRTGVAEALLCDAHRREWEAGVRYAALWTNRSWGAHHLYEKLGYRDVYSAHFALHLPTAARPRASRVRFARPSDLDEIDRLHDRLAEGRVGYCRRLRGSLRADVRFRYIDPATDLLVRRQDGELVGYAHLDRDVRRVVCGEMVATALAVKRELVVGVEWTANRLPTAFQHTLVTDSPRLFRGRSYMNGRASWYGMLAADLSREWTTREAEKRFGTRDPRFICLTGDQF